MGLLAPVIHKAKSKLQKMVNKYHAEADSYVHDCDEAGTITIKEIIRLSCVYRINVIKWIIY